MNYQSVFWEKKKIIINFLSAEFAPEVVKIKTDEFIYYLKTVISDLLGAFEGKGILTQCIGETPKRVTSKQCRFRSDAAECVV